MAAAHGHGNRPTQERTDHSGIDRNDGKDKHETAGQSSAPASAAPTKNHDEPAGVASPVSRQKRHGFRRAELGSTSTRRVQWHPARCPPEGPNARLATGRRYDRHHRRQAAAAGASPFSAVRWSPPPHPPPFFFLHESALTLTAAGHLVSVVSFIAGMCPMFSVDVLVAESPAGCMELCYVINQRRAIFVDMAC